MPAAFERCLKKKGHRVRTIKYDDGRYRHICFVGKKSYAGEIHTPESKARALKKLK